jgi:septum formation protein
VIILASQSPRRRELLERAGVSFVVRAADVDESVQSGELPRQYVRRLAMRKALAVEREPQDCVIAADTTVVIGESILGKPADEADAAAMLHRLQGRPHEVITGICLRHGSDLYVDAATTVVHMDPMTEAQIRAYVASREPMDKAGAYGIQGLASRYISRIEGCYFNVVGLPVSLVCRYLVKLGVL